jgi:hypothetical protein
MLLNASTTRHALPQQQQRGVAQLAPAQPHRLGASFRRGGALGSCGLLARPARRRQQPVRARSDEEEPDWDKEMSIFKQRTM